VYILFDIFLNKLFRLLLKIYSIIVVHSYDSTAGKSLKAG